MKRITGFLFLLFAISSLPAQNPAPPAGGWQGNPAQGGQRPGAPQAPAAPALAQRPQGSARVSGSVIDSLDSQPLGYVSVVLFDLKANKPLEGGFTDTRGEFSFKNIPAGSYRLQASLAGYKMGTGEDFSLAEGQRLELPPLRLAQPIKNLDEVVIASQRNLVEEKVDRLVYNAEKDITSKGGDASEVLRKVPMLSVDFDGNVSLRGSSNIQVLINNKPSTIIAANVGDALRQIPADMIKSVEVITSPSARYDAEGSGGIINIITKKNTLQGLRLNVDTGVGNRGANLGLNGSYRKGNMGFNLGGFGRFFYNPAITTLEQTTRTDNGSFQTLQNIDAFDRGVFGRYSLGFDYDLKKNQSLTAGLRYGTRNFIRDQEFQSTFWENGIQTGSSARNVDARDLSGTIDANVDYVRIFKPGKELSFSTLYSRSGLTNNFNADLFNDSGAISERQRNLNSNLNQEITAQTDYQTPLGEKQILEFGAKGIFRIVNSDYRYEIATTPTADYVLDVLRPAGSLDYRQNVGAAYSAWTAGFGKGYSLKAGLRFEYTSITAETEENGSFEVPDYYNLVPSVNLSKKLKDNLTFKAGYNRRIQRPGLQQLNPNFNAANPQNISVGNPALEPELTDNVEMSLSASLKQSYINFSVFGRNTGNSITQVRRIADSLSGAVITTFENIGSQQALGVNVFGNYFITPKWSVSGGVDLTYQMFEGQVAGLNGQSVSLTNSGFNVNGRLMTQITLAKGWGIQGFSFMRGSQVQLQGREGGFGMYSVAVKKDFKNKRGSIGIGGENFFSRGIRVRTVLESPQFSQTVDNLRLNRGVRVNFSYQIGKIGFEPPVRKRTKGVNNDDLKGDEGGGGEGGQMPQGGGGRGRNR